MQQIFRGLGVFSVRFRWVIVVAWFVITLASVKLFPGLNTIAQSGNNAFLPADSPSSKALPSWGQKAPAFRHGDEWPIPLPFLRRHARIAICRVA